MTIIEPTSGNTGIGLAVIGIIKGYDVEIVMSSGVSVERRKIIRSYGAKVTLTPAELGTDGAINLAHQLVDENPGKYFMPDQFTNAANYMAHYNKTALEIWNDADGNIDYLVCAVGTSGTLEMWFRYNWSRICLIFPYSIDSVDCAPASHLCSDLALS